MLKQNWLKREREREREMGRTSNIERGENERRGERERERWGRGRGMGVRKRERKRGENERERGRTRDIERGERERENVLCAEWKSEKGRTNEVLGVICHQLNVLHVCIIHSFQPNLDAGVPKHVIESSNICLALFPLSLL